MFYIVKVDFLFYVVYNEIEAKLSENNMSIDIDLTINTGIMETSVVVVGDMTHNVQPMWRKAIKETSDLDMNLCDFNGWIASDAHLIIKKALDHMRKNTEEYTPMNPENGWGSYETAVDYLSDLLIACIDHPTCTIRTDC